MTLKRNTHVFIGYDPSQDLAYRTCKKSIETASGGSSSVFVHKLCSNEMRKLGFFSREWIIEGSTGRYKDVLDEKNFSTYFSHSRFLTPAYAIFLGVQPNDLIIFVDSDFIFLRNPEELAEIVDSEPSKIVFCVKHKYNPKGSIKMNNAVQEGYEYKLWTSLMVFRIPYCAQALNTKVINEMPGSYLHQFGWLSDPGHQIGKIPEGWNFIPDHSEGRVQPSEICAIHYTEGTPLLKGYETCKYSAVFNHYYREVLKDMSKEVF